MKMRWYDRVLVVLAGLVPTGLGLFLVLVSLRIPSGPYLFTLQFAEALLGPRAMFLLMDFRWYTVVLLLAAGLVLLAWGLRVLMLPFFREAKRKEAYIQAQDTPNGSLQISIDALTNLVCKCLGRHPEFMEPDIEIKGSEEGVSVKISTTLQAGVHIPRVTARVREDVREYLDTCAGIKISDVTIVVEDTAAGPDLPELLPQPVEVASLVEEIPPMEAVEASVEEVETPSAETEELDIEAELAKVDAGGQEDA